VPAATVQPEAEEEPLKKVPECKAMAETFVTSPGGVGPTNTVQAVDCLGDALRGQGKDPSQLKLDLDVGGTIGLSAPGRGSMKLKGYQDEEQAVVAAPAWSYCGSVPPVSDMHATFRDTLCSHRAEVAKEVTVCEAEAVTIDTSFGAASLTGVMQTGGCMGDASQRPGSWRSASHP
jgi:hypothetical protein